MAKKIKIGVIHFPGTNCELEAIRACKRAGMEADFLRWNEEINFKAYDGFILPGGFSYEDRGRSGIIASKDPVLKKIKQEAKKGKPIIGICNGAQVLIESGLVPGFDDSRLDMALAWNERIKNNEILGTGFYNDWVYIKSDTPNGSNAFNYFDKKTLIKCPVAHGEGRFLTQDKKLLKKLIENNQTAFRYCDQNGKVINEFPFNPNNAIYSLAGVTNVEGNVMALMPHPERTENGDAIFHSMAAYISKKFTIKKPSSAKKQFKPDFKEEAPKKFSEKSQLEIFVEMIITDNEERTIEHAVHDIGYTDIKLKKFSYFGIKTTKKTDLKKLAASLIKSGELLNTNKEIPHVKIGNEWFDYDTEKELVSTKFNQKFDNSYLVFERNNYTGKSVLSGVKKHFGIKEVSEIKKGYLWILTGKNIKKTVESHIFHNPHSALIYQY